MPPDTSPIPDYVADRGPTKYFHGRVQILRNFDKLVKDSMEPGGGSTFLIQGAPGVGKTALLYECGKLAKGNGWEVAKIKTGALWDKGKMLRTLGFGKMVGIDNVSLGLSEAFTAKISLSKPARSTTSLNVVEKRKRKPLLLVLDEAQRLSNANELPKTQFDEAGDLLEAIHNGELNKPVILLAAGLGSTGEAFRSLGISRFKGGCFVELGALGRASERAVIKDWLVKDGGAKGDPTTWIDQIAQKTHGWPQHISAYGDAAAKQIQHDHGEMTAAGLDMVYRVGAERRRAYYRHRVSGFDGNELICLYEAVAGINSRTPFNKDLVLSPLNKKYESDLAEKIFKKFIDKRVVSVVGTTMYSVPIPSMHDWMRSEFEHVKEQMAALRDARETNTRPSPPKDFGMER